MSAIRFRRYNLLVLIALFVLSALYLTWDDSLSLSASLAQPPLTESIHQPGRIQFPFTDARHAGPQPKRLARVKDEFLHSWAGYKKYAWTADELRPLSARNNTKFCGWAATLVDSLDTLWIMDLKSEFEEAVEAIAAVDFAKASHCTVNLFEVTIRHLGGLLAAYDLSGRKDQRLYTKAVEVGELLYAAFDTYNGMPQNHYAWPKNPAQKMEPSKNIALAAIGSLNLEFTHLSDITKDPKYYLATEKVSKELALSQRWTSIPGLWPAIVDSAGPGGLNEFHSQEYSLGALSDSTYEYLPKAHLMFGDRSTIYEDMWNLASPQIYTHLLYRPMTPDNADILFSGKTTGKEASTTFRAEAQHLACFQGGMFGLASKVFNRPVDMVTAQKLTEGCVWAYRSSPHGIMPETAQMLRCPGGIEENCKWDQEAWDKVAMDADVPLGFKRIDDKRYLLRPEAIESVFLMWRMTGNTYWREAGWTMFESIIEATRTPIAHAAIDHVMDASNPPIQLDEVESFWFAETLKYFYLLFADSRLVGLDEWVLNTEAHPFRLRSGAAAAAASSGANAAGGAAAGGANGAVDHAVGRGV